MWADLISQKGKSRRGVMKAKVEGMPAPTGGWNTRDPLQAMDAKDSPAIVNLIPGTGDVRLRGGTENLVSGLTGNYVETLMTFSAPNGTEHLLAATPNRIERVDTGGISNITTGKTNGRWSYLNMATAAETNFLCMVNGADGYFTWDGTTFTDRSAAVTGLTVANARLIAQHAGRLWFAETSKLTIWYLGVAAITGAATKFPIGQFFKRGGSIVSMNTWTRDGGDGSDDNFVVVTSNGEVGVWQGTDPASADTWELIGVYRISDPIGLRSTLKVGGDLGALTAAGVGLISQFIGTNKSGQSKITITNKISPTFSESYKAYKDNFGWQIVEFPRDSLVLVNVPTTERTTSVQFVLNVETGAWTKFTGINALCWELYQGRLFYGTPDGKVVEYGIDSFSDNGDPIDFELQWAFRDFGTAQEKTVSQVRTLITGPNDFLFGVDIKVDFEKRATDATAPAYLSTGLSYWDTSPWDTSPWGSLPVRVGLWQTVDGCGRAISPAIVGSISEELRIAQMDVMFQPGLFL